MLHVVLVCFNKKKGVCNVHANLRTQVAAFIQQQQ